MDGYLIMLSKSDQISTIQPNLMC